MLVEFRKSPGSQGFDRFACFLGRQILTHIQYPNIRSQIARKKFGGIYSRCVEAPE